MSPKEQDVSIVYRTVMPSGNSSSAAAFNLESLGSVQQAKYRDLIRADQITEPKDLKGFAMCPAHNEWVKNCYVYRSPLSIDITTSENGRLDVKLPTVMEDYRNDRMPQYRWDERKHVFEIDFIYDHLFYSEDEVTFEMVPAFFEKDVLPVTPCSMKINNWVRPIHPAFLMTDVTEMHIKEGQPIAYYRFLSEKKIKFVDFEFNEPEFMTIVNTLSNIRYVTGRRTLRQYYDIFHRGHTQKKLLSVIKRNIMEK